jgi:predicted proteasome-type protease
LEPRIIVLVKASSNLTISQSVMTVVSSQLRRAETQELEGLIIEPLSSNCHLSGDSLKDILQLSGIMSHVTHVYMVF